VIVNWNGKLYEVVSSTDRIVVLKRDGDRADLPNFSVGITQVTIVHR